MHFPQLRSHCKFRHLPQFFLASRQPKSFGNDTAKFPTCSTTTVFRGFPLKNTSHESIQPLQDWTFTVSGFNISAFAYDSYMNLRIISGIIAETPAIPRIFFFETLVASRFLQTLCSLRRSFADENLHELFLPGRPPACG